MSPSLFIQPFGSQKFRKTGEFRERDVPVLTPTGTEPVCDFHRALHYLWDRKMRKVRTFCRHTEAHPIFHGTACRRRGSRTVNSVKSPTSLSTAMVPPCCCVTIS